MSCFGACFARIDRAHQHGQAAINSWQDLLNDNPASGRARREAHGIAVASIVFAKPLGDGTPISLELGEFFYQLRAALDGAAYEFACILCKPSHPIDESQLYFPILAKPSYFQKCAFNANPFPQELKVWVESIQPYNIHKLAGNDKALAIWLEKLNHFARLDRHRKLHLAMVGPSEITGHIELPSSLCRITFTEGIASNFLEGNFDFLRFGVSHPSDGEDGMITVHGEITPQIAIEGLPVPPWEGLLSMERVTRYVVERFSMMQESGRFTW